MPMPLTKPSIENDALMARYPFLPQGNEFLKSILNKNGITVDDLIEEPWLEEVRARGRVRLLESVMHKEGVDAATTIDFHAAKRQDPPAQKPELAALRQQPKPRTHGLVH